MKLVYLVLFFSSVILNSKFFKHKNSGPERSNIELPEAVNCGGGGGLTKEKVNA
jgi:hypothetical protein